VEAGTASGNSRVSLSHGSAQFYRRAAQSGGAAVNTTESESLLLTALEAAKLLSVSEKTLWNNTTPRGTVPCVRFPMSRTVRYDPEALRAWIAEQREQSVST
jgi:predicted DNA-binding transcriptional regulator AlpA